MLGRRLFCISCATISALLSGVAAQEENVQLIDSDNVPVTTLTNLTEAPSSASPSTSFAPTLHPTATPTMRPTYLPDLIFKVNETEAVDFDSMRLHPGKCDEAYQYCIDVPLKEEGETADSLSQKFRRDFPHFSDAWMNHISAHIRNNFDAYMSAEELGVSDGGSSSTVSVYSVGVVIGNYYGMDYLNNKFKVDMKIYIREIEETTTKTLSEVRAEAYDVNNPAVAEMEGADGPSYHELLTKPWDDVKSERRYKNAIPKRNTFCSIEYHDKMKMISESDYKKKFGSGIVIQHSTTVPSPVVDPKGDILYLKAFGAQISFTAPNERFYPLQTDILPIKLNLPRRREMDRSVLCIDQHFTGFHLPMENANRMKTDVPYLSLVPTITSERAPPFLGNDHSSMRNQYLKTDTRRNGNDGSKVVGSATFTLIFIPEYNAGLSKMYTYLFLILTTLLQWFTHTPDKFSNSQMVTAIIQLNSVVNAQTSKYMEYNNKLTDLVLLTFVIVIANILTIALMAHINSCQEKGVSPTLVRLKGTIFRLLRVFDILLALLLLPILIVKTDPLTGKQEDYEFLWYVTGFVALFVFSFRSFKEYKKYKKASAERNAEKEAGAKAAEEEIAMMSSLSPGSEWTPVQIGNWIANSEIVRETSALTEGELVAISSKFVDANVNGIVFPLVAHDADVLKRDVNLTVGEAVLFVHTMEKLSAHGEEITLSAIGGSQDNFVEDSIQTAIQP